MKKILLLAVLFISVKSFGQWFPQSVGSKNTDFYSKGTSGADSGFVQRFCFVDTIQANLGTIKNKPGIYIRTCDDVTWMRNNAITAWIRVGSGGPTKIYVKDDLTVDSFSNIGYQTLGRQRSNGLYRGGIVTKNSCLSLDVTPADISIGGKSYLTAPTTLSVTAADPTFPRTDDVIADTFGLVSIITGTPSATPVTPQINPSSQVLLTTYTIAAGASCVGINTIVIYDETGGTEYTPSTSGTITADPNNTDNPQHLTKADFISVYADGAKRIFTKPSGQDTVFNNSVFKWFMFLNNPFNNSLQMQLFLGSTPITNNIVINPYFNSLNTGVYQNVSLPAYAFNFTGGRAYDNMVFTFAGNDLSGAIGLYNDYIQLQTGITNTGPFVPTTLQQATDASIAAGDNPFINNHGLSFVIDSLDEMDIISYGTKGINLLVKDPSTGAVLTNRSSDNQRIFDFIQNPDGINSVSITQISDVNGNTIEMAGGSAGSANLKLVITNLDTLPAPTTYIAAFDGDSLKKVAYPTGGGGTETLQQAFDVAPTANPQINAHLENFHIDSTGEFVVNAYDDQNNNGYFNIGANNNALTSVNSVDNKFSSFESNVGDIDNTFGRIRAESGTGTDSSTIQNLNLYPKYSKFSGQLNGNAKTKLIIESVDTLSSHPPYIAAFDGDTLKKTVIPLVPFTPANSTDNSFPNGTSAADDNFLYYRKSDGTWVKIAWTTF